MEQEGTIVLKARIPKSTYFAFRQSVAERKGRYKGFKDESVTEAIQKYVSEQEGTGLSLSPDLKEAVKTWCDNTGIRYENAIPMLVKIGFKARELLEVPPRAREDAVDSLLEFMKKENL